MSNSQPRLTLSPAFRRYPWRSKAMLYNTWPTTSFTGAEKFIRKLDHIDVHCFPSDDYNVDNMEFRALLGVKNRSNKVVKITANSTSNVAGSFAITMLRFQVLDWLLSTVPDGLAVEKYPCGPPPKVEVACQVLFDSCNNVWL